MENAEVLHDAVNTLVDSVKTLTTKQDRHPTSGVIMYQENRENGSEYRNLSPRERFLLMGFEESDYDNLMNHNFLVRKTKNLYTRERLERLAGNSIVVEALKSIFGQVDELQGILEAIGAQQEAENRKKLAVKRIKKNRTRKNYTCKNPRVAVGREVQRQNRSNATNLVKYFNKFGGTFYARKLYNLERGL